MRARRWTDPASAASTASNSARSSGASGIPPAHTASLRSARACPDRISARTSALMGISGGAFKSFRVSLMLPGNAGLSERRNALAVQFQNDAARIARSNFQPFARLKLFRFARLHEMIENSVPSATIVRITVLLVCTFSSSGSAAAEQALAAAPSFAFEFCTAVLPAVAAAPPAESFAPRAASPDGPEATGPTGTVAAAGFVKPRHNLPSESHIGEADARQNHHQHNRRHDRRLPIARHLHRRVRHHPGIYSASRLQRILRHHAVFIKPEKSRHRPNESPIEHSARQRFPLSLSIASKNRVLIRVAADTSSSETPLISRSRFKCSPNGVDDIPKGPQPKKNIGVGRRCVNHTRNQKIIRCTLIGLRSNPRDVHCGN